MMVAQTNTPRLKTLYNEEVSTKAISEFGLKNRHQLPVVEEAIVNCGSGRFREDQKLEPAARDTRHVSA